MSLRARIPWYAKILIKIILARIPIDYNYWKRRRLFRHGDMDRPAYAYDLYKTHYGRVNFPRKDRGFIALELGPGDSLFSALIAYAFNAASIYLVDVGRYVRDDVVQYQLMIDFLTDHNLSIPDIKGKGSIYEFLEALNAHYEVEGIKSLQKISDRTIDFVWSHAVLEHVRRDKFLETLCELRRILRMDGVCSHRIDLKDHLGGGLNNLRFSTSFWESDFISQSGFYTNRIRFNEMFEFFKIAGFDVEVLNIDRWPQLPTPRNKLSVEFRQLEENDLLVSGFDVVLTPH